MVEREVDVRGLIVGVVRSLVSRPGEIEVDEQTGEDRTTFHVRVNAADESGLIGKNGMTARALRTIVSACGAKLGRKCEIVIETAPRS